MHASGMDLGSYGGLRTSYMKPGYVQGMEHGVQEGKGSTEYVLQNTAPHLAIADMLENQQAMDNDSVFIFP